MCDFDNEEVIKTLFENGFLDKNNYEIALEKGLYRCKFNEISDYAFQYVTLDIGRKVNSKNEAEGICKQFADYLSNTLLNLEDDFYYEEGWAAHDFTTIKADPIRAGYYEYDTDEYHTLLIVKITYNYLTKLTNDCDRFEECEDVDECLEYIEQVKDGLKMFLDNTVANEIYDCEGGFFSMNIADYIENELPGICFYNNGEVNVDDLEELTSSFEDNDVNMNDVVGF